jgi:hypothetical protein
MVVVAVTDTVGILQFDCVIKCIVLDQLVDKKLIVMHGTNSKVKFVCGSFINVSQYADGSVSMADEDEGSWWKVYRERERQAIHKMNFLNATFCITNPTY